jgi:hypothetical protein
LIEKKEQGEEIRFWSIGCSTGEEAYTLAIILSEILQEKITKYKIKIFATDIDDESLKIARMGVYAEASLININKNLLNKYPKKYHKIAVKDMFVYKVGYKYKSSFLPFYRGLDDFEYEPQQINVNIDLCGQTIDNEYRIKLIEEKMQLDSIIKMEAFNTAKQNYDKKINNIVDLLVKEGFSHLFFRIEQISKCGAELEFLISNDKKEVHARLIYVQGPIQAPHFRFITTVRQK